MFNQSVRDFLSGQVIQTTASSTRERVSPEKGFGEEMSYESLTESGQRLGGCHIIQQFVPGLQADKRESPVGDGCQLDQRYCQMVGVSRTERSAARQVGDIVEWTTLC